MKRLHVTPVLWLLCLPVFGQLNLKAGYSLTLLDAPVYDGIVATHNQMQVDSYTDPFTPLNILHGLDLGLEYRWESFALDWGWRIKRNRQVATGSQAQRSFDNKLNFSIGAFYMGLVQYAGPIRLAGSIDYNYTIIKLDFEEPSILHTIKDHGLGSTFSLGYVIPGRGGISICLAPYVKVPWTDYDLTEFQSRLTGDTTPPEREEFLNYGITLFFLNGPQ